MVLAAAAAAAEEEAAAPEAATAAAADAAAVAPGAAAAMGRPTAADAGRSDGAYSAQSLHEDGAFGKHPVDHFLMPICAGHAGVYRTAQTLNGDLGIAMLPITSADIVIM